MNKQPWNTYCMSNTTFKKRVDFWSIKILVRI
uniref:Uncharacterized protein n=1 Tax=Anguilla anguilla TaxID=7936 RepID=A0A0E9VLR2_ANGAN